MPIRDLFTGQSPAPTRRKGLLDVTGVARKGSVAPGTPRVSKPSNLPPFGLPRPQYAPSTEEQQEIERMQGERRTRHAPGSEPYVRTPAYDDPSNWFLTADGERLFFDPLYRQGRRARAGELAKDPYRIGDVPGYEDAVAPWRMQLDQTIIREAGAFNRRHGYGPEDRGYVTPAFWKALMMGEAGGNGPRWRRAWLSDPAQIYNEGDWTKESTPERARVMGVPGPKARPGITPQESIRGGLEWFDRWRTVRNSSGREVRYRDPREAAWKYNGNTNRDPNGREHRDNYADDVMARYQGMLKR